MCLGSPVNGHTPGHSQLDAALGEGHDPADKRKEEQTTMQ